MRSTKSIILIVVALACGLTTAIGIRQLLAQPDTKVADTASIFVAATNVPSWSKLNAQVVKQEEWPKDKIPQGAARTLEEFEGKSSLYPLYPGEPILTTKLSDSNGTNPSVRIPEGHQVFAVKVDKESALSGLINPGDKVDVLVFIRGRSSGSERIRTGTRTIMRNTTVFAVNDQMARNEEESSIDAKTVSLLVLPEQSEKLLLAKQLGTIHLALRKPGDESKMATDGAQPGDLDQESEGSDGMLSSNNQPKPSGGIFDILTEMKGASSTAVDTSNAAQASGPTSTMVIMSPDGVLGSYSFDDNHGQRSGLPALPTELLGGASQNAEPTDSTVRSEPEPADTNTVDGDDVAPQGDTEDTKVDVLDPADLGL